MSATSDSVEARTDPAELGDGLLVEWDERNCFMRAVRQ